MDVAEKNEKKAADADDIKDIAWLSACDSDRRGFADASGCDGVGKIRFPDGVIYCDNLRLRDGACSCSDLFVLDIIW